MVNKIKLTTQFDFDAAHRLVGYAGKCSNMHGHIWKVELEIEGTTDMLDCCGILWDFTNAKMLKDLFDHKTILMDCDANYNLKLLLMKEKNEVYMMDKNPTAENLCSEIIDHLKTSNPDLKYKVIVWESPKSSCEVESE